MLSTIVYLLCKTVNLETCCFFEVIVVDDDHIDDFNGDKLFLVVNSYMQIGDDIGGEHMYVNVGVDGDDLLDERMHY